MLGFSPIGTNSLHINFVLILQTIMGSLVNCFNGKTFGNIPLTMPINFTCFQSSVYIAKKLTSGNMKSDIDATVLESFTTSESGVESIAVYFGIPLFWIKESNIFIPLVFSYFPNLEC